MIRVLAVSLLLGLYIIGANDPAFGDSGTQVSVLSGSHARNGARQSRPPAPAPLDEARAALAKVLEPAERVDVMVMAIGCVLVLTSLRLLVIRDGASYRPTSGIRSWPLDRELTLHLGRSHRQTRRLAIGHPDGSASVFVAATHLGEGERFIAEVRRRIYGPR